MSKMLVQMKSLSGIFHKEEVMKKIFLKKLIQNLLKNTLYSINLSLYDLYVHEYTLC